jgi:hypothetical protein
MTSNRYITQAAARAGSITTVLDGSAAVEQIVFLRDKLTTGATTEAVAYANTGTVSVTTAGAATFSSTLAGSGATIGDTIVIGTGASAALFTLTAGSGTAWTVSPAPAVAITTASFVLNNAGSYVDLPAVNLRSLRPVPELFRMRYAGTGTLTSTVKWQRVNATTGVATDITTAVALNSAGTAVWQGVAAADTPPGEQTEMGRDEFLRLRITTLGTVPAAAAPGTGNTRHLHIELGFARRTGPHLQ